MLPKMHRERLQERLYLCMKPLMLRVNVSVKVSNLHKKQWNSCAPSSYKLKRYFQKLYNCSIQTPNELKLLVAFYAI